jgi:xylose isomerase
MPCSPRTTDTKAEGQAPSNLKVLWDVSSIFYTSRNMDTNATSPNVIFMCPVGTREGLLHNT